MIRFELPARFGRGFSCAVNDIQFVEIQEDTQGLETFQIQNNHYNAIYIHKPQEFLEQGIHRILALMSFKLSCVIATWSCHHVSHGAIPIPLQDQGQNQNQCRARITISEELESECNQCRINQQPAQGQFAISAGPVQDQWEGLD